MELADTWTCSCGAENTGDVFTAPCWKCHDNSWSTKPLRVETAEELGMCPDCQATDGFHTMSCPTHPLPGVTRHKDAKP